MGKSKATNRSAGLKRAPSAFALFCGHVARAGVPYPPTRRVHGKQLVNNKECVLRKWKSNPTVKEEWKAKAKEKAQTNSLARDLHKVISQGMKIGPCREADAIEEPIDTSNLKFTWMGLVLKVEKLLASGTYGRVYIVEGNNFKFAAKVLKNFDASAPHQEDDIHNLRDLAKEASLHLRFSSCPFVVPAIGLASLEDQNTGTFQNSSLLMELCDGSLFNALRRQQGEVPFNQRLAWSIQVAAGLCHLHSQKVIHLDLKLDNILIGSSRSGSFPRAMISDFGLAKVTGANGEITIPVNTAYAAPYRPPECTMFVPAADAARDRPKAHVALTGDMWAYGCCLFAIFAMRPLVADVESYQRLCTASKSIPEMLAETLSPVLSSRVEKHLDEALVPFVKSCLVPAPCCREKAVGLHRGLANLFDKGASP